LDLPRHCVFDRLICLLQEDAPEKDCPRYGYRDAKPTRRIALVAARPPDRGGGEAMHEKTNLEDEADILELLMGQAAARAATA
jgi:hypothetical protein